MPEYLKLPLKFEPFFEKRKLDTCTPQQSIARNLHLLITTTTGEHKQDAAYGAGFWDHDYDIHLSNDARREMVIDSLQRQIAAYEKRLVAVVVEVNVKQVPVNESVGTRLRRRIEIIVQGNLARSNEPFRFATGFFIGPMAFD
ncbi:GPW/gp25 family protein [Taibaiella koreensis]|uniref:GPW/gp25 family protein n=1 Tax=Taibaiella koreensis TaxID=1268548 RepID=UPI000E59D67F|nr:GPW/gp25 family protein [Taibaiella koreensis]